MIAKQELERWLSTLADDATLAIDEGGLTLVTVGQGEGTESYLEIGGVPDGEPEGE